MVPHGDVSLGTSLKEGHCIEPLSGEVPILMALYPFWWGIANLTPTLILPTLFKIEILRSFLDLQWGSEIQPFKIRKQ